MQLGYRLKRENKYRRTTIAGKIYYPNKIKGLEINAPSLVWQSDITYYKVGDNKAPEIHHSDRGSQYTYKLYTNLLKSHTTTKSMALSAQNNAYAERINRTIKEESRSLEATNL